MNRKKVVINDGVMRCKLLKRIEITSDEIGHAVHGRYVCVAQEKGF